jgi:hypothetical protein
MDAIIVPCTQEKIWDDTRHARAGAVAAKNAYTKPEFKDWRRYAEESGSPWFILSTKYGLIRPDQPIERYNVPISAAVANPELHQMLERQGRELGLSDVDRVVLLDWERFQPLVKAALGGANVPCILRRIRY